MIDVERLRVVTNLWATFCNCGGPQPSPTDYKTDRHSQDCLYVEKIFVIEPVDESGNVRPDASN